MLNQSLTYPFENNSQPTEETLKKYITSCGQFKNTIIQEDQKALEKRTQKLRQFYEKFKILKDKAISNRKECEENITKLKEEVQTKKSTLNQYQSKIYESNKEEDYQKQIAAEQLKYVENCKKRIQIANDIKIQKLKKIDIAEKYSKANDLFKWIIVAMYLEPVTKYYWDNFKNQAFYQDQGKDFIQRLGKINAFNAKEEQRIKTNQFIDNFDSMIECEEFKDIEEQIQKFNQIAVLFLSCTDIGRKVRKLQRMIEQSKESLRKDQQENIQEGKTLDALSQRVRISEDYLRQLRKIQESLGEKEEVYGDKIKNAKQYIQNISKIATFSGISIKQEVEKRDECECTIY